MRILNFKEFKEYLIRLDLERDNIRMKLSIKDIKMLMDKFGTVPLLIDKIIKDTFFEDGEQSLFYFYQSDGIQDYEVQYLVKEYYAYRFYHLAEYLYCNYINHVAWGRKK